MCIQFTCFTSTKVLILEGRGGTHASYLVRAGGACVQAAASECVCVRAHARVCVCVRVCGGGGGGVVCACASARILEGQRVPSAALQYLYFGTSICTLVLVKQVN